MILFNTPEAAESFAKIQGKYQNQLVCAADFLVMALKYSTEIEPEKLAEKQAEIEQANQFLSKVNFWLGSENYYVLTPCNDSEILFSSYFVDADNMPKPDLDSCYAMHGALVKGIDANWSSHT